MKFMSSTLVFDVFDMLPTAKAQPRRRRVDWVNLIVKYGMRRAEAALRNPYVY